MRLEKCDFIVRHRVFVRCSYPCCCRRQLSPDSWPLGGQAQPQNGQASQPSQDGTQQSTASPPMPSQPAHRPAAKAMESMVVSRIHMVNQLEIKAGELAAKKGSAFDVREYGDRLQLDHKKADGMVLGYAKTHGLQVMSPTEIQVRMQQMPGSVPEAETKPKQMEQQGMQSPVRRPSRTAVPAADGKIQSTMQKLQGLQGKRSTTRLRSSWCRATPKPLPC